VSGAVRVPEDIDRNTLPLPRQDLVDGGDGLLLPRLDIPGTPEHSGARVLQ
jgi:hypothetical protein